MIILVRHGRTAANAAGLLQGRADLPLDEIGRAQANGVGTTLALSSSPPARVITSPLRRAVETAAAIAPGAIVDERWIELDYGELDGQPVSGVPASMWDGWRRDIDFAPQGGESLRALGARVRDACASLVEEAAEHDVVVVTHVSPIKAAVAWALGVDDEVAWRMFVAPASITRLGVGDRGPMLRSFNEASHLG